VNSRSSVNASVYWAVALAAALGGALRHAISVAWLQAGGAGFPWPTLLVNVLGSLLIAVYWRLAGPDARFPAGLERRTAVMTGFCGGLTTFSLFGVETFQLLQGERVLSAAGYIGLTMTGALGAAWLGCRTFGTAPRGRNDVS